MALSTINAKIKNIVISGGGAVGFAFYGALKNSYERGLWNHDNIERIYSTSAGSIISIFISLGYDWKTTDDYIIKRPWNELYKCELPMAIQAIKNQGLFGQHIIRETFLPLFRGKDISIDVTLEELYQYNKRELHFITTDYDTFEYLDISYKTHPTWRVIDAVYASCCLPVLFSPFYGEDNKVYIDGGIRLNYPLEKCLKDGCDTDEILGIKILHPPSLEDNNILHSHNIFEVIHKLFHKCINNLEMPYPETPIKYQCDVILASMDLNAIFKCINSEEERVKMINYGIQCSLDHIFDELS
jgi:predicted acylesterase/phospholipase RssA